MDDVEDVRRANRGFYAAFESLDIERMRAVWRFAPHVQCTHPGWQRLSGFDAVMESWRRIFEHALSMRFQVEDEEITVSGDSAWVVCREQIRSQTPDGTAVSLVEATNLFEREDGRWLVVHHHGSPLLQRFADEEPETPLH